MDNTRARQLHTAALFIMLLLLCCSASAEVIEDEGRPVRFAVIGDRTGSPVPGIYDQIVLEIQRLRPDLLLTVGDMVEEDSGDRDKMEAAWKEYEKIISPLSMPIHFVPGNNDIFTDATEEIYRRHAGEPYYSFDYCGIHFIMLDNCRWESSEELPAEQMAWLVDDLDKYRDAKNTIAFMHKPFWYNTTATGKPDTLHSLFRTFGVDAVFTGHFHQYFVGEYDGIIYTGLGSSGGGDIPVWAVPAEVRNQAPPV
jgi:3',5'-cyclic AMP phosphodiesterase CpdA